VVYLSLERLIKTGSVSTVTVAWTWLYMKNFKKKTIPRRSRFVSHTFGLLLLTSESL
jgi:hypothetical protein